MSTLYGDNIFVESLELQYNHIIESSKLFTDFEIVTEAEGNFKDKILKAIKDVIQKVKDFFKWIKEKVLKFVNSIVDKVKKLNLKKKLNDVKSKLKKSNNESAILTEATYSELEDWLKTEVKTYYQHDLGMETGEFIRATSHTIDIRKENNKYIVYSKFDSGKSDEYTARDVYVDIRDTSIESFVSNYESDINSLKRMIELINNKKSKLEAEIRELEKQYRELDNIKSIEDLKQALNDKNKNEHVRREIHDINNAVNNATKMINISTTCIKDIEKTANQINIKLLTFGHDDDEFI